MTPGARHQEALALLLPLDPGPGLTNRLLVPGTGEITVAVQQPVVEQGAEGKGDGQLLGPPPRWIKDSWPWVVEKRSGQPHSRCCPG